MMSSTTPTTTDTAAPGDLPLRMDGWTHHAKTYSNVERMTYPLAIELAGWTDSVLAFTTPDSRVLDNGCGGGVLGSAIKTLCPTVSLLSTDVSAGMISSARARAEKEHWQPPFEFKTLDARDLDGVESESVTHSMSQYMISLAPDPDQIAREMHRVLKPGGVLGLGTWAMVDYECFYRPMLVAARETIPDFDLPGLMHEKWTDIERTRGALKEAGFTDVQVRPKDIEWEYPDVESVMHYVFEEGNPGVEAYTRSWVEQSGKGLDEIQPGFARAVKVLYEKDGGKVLLPVKAAIWVARK